MRGRAPGRVGVMAGLLVSVLGALAVATFVLALFDFDGGSLGPLARVLF